MGCERFICSLRIDICHYKVMKYAAIILRYIYTESCTKGPTLLPMTIIATMKAFTQMFDWSEPERLQTLSSSFPSLSQEEFKVMAIHESKPIANSGFVHICVC